MTHLSKNWRRLIAAVAVVLPLASAIYIVYRMHQPEQPGGAYESMQGWQPIGGRWSAQGSIYSNSNYGRGDMLIAPHSQGTNYRISADIRFDLLFPDTHYGDAGLVIRTTDPQQGVDSYQGYYAGVRADDQVIILGRASFDWHELKAVRLNSPVSVGSWYHLDLSVHGCNIAVALAPVSGGPSTQLEFDDQHCLTEGVAGLRSFYAQASWRNVVVTPN